jgi:hypothetical protein
MPTSDDLTGLGMSPILAAAVGNNFSSLGCLGTTQGTAAKILTKNVELVPSSSQTGAVLQATVHVGSPVFMFNAQSTGAVIYVPTSDRLNGTTDGTFTLAQNKSAYLIKYKVLSGNGYWAANLTA